ncbi:hypothetical protein [Streptomyces iconiensis]|uniref:Uncharacterized protein n=1 Tax=Streptomyces iconiensis TaxID=1384038 RepID=A0ABT7A980_9ACTN|nr:hypothetical protein [Streptomyces iconiensis]MDJ1137914.1 hypothetical protein [Streptomyces iconiensis]
MISRIHVTTGIATMSSPGTEVRIDGEPLPGVRSVDMSTAFDIVPTVTVELMAREVVVDGEAQVELPAGMEDALRKLGWTPPGETREPSA